MDKFYGPSENMPIQIYVHLKDDNLSVISSKPIASVTFLSGISYILDQEKSNVESNNICNYLHNLLL